MLEGMSGLSRGVYISASLGPAQPAAYCLSHTLSYDSHALAKSPLAQT